MPDREMVESHNWYNSHSDSRGTGPFRIFDTASCGAGFFHPTFLAGLYLYCSTGKQGLSINIEKRQLIPLRKFLQKQFESKKLLEMRGPAKDANALKVGCELFFAVDFINRLFGASHVDAFDVDPNMAFCKVPFYEPSGFFGAGFTKPWVKYPAVGHGQAIGDCTDLEFIAGVGVHPLRHNHFHLNDQLVVDQRLGGEQCFAAKPGAGMKPVK